MTKPLFALGAAMAIGLSGCAAPAGSMETARPAASVAEGLAQRQCGQCHAVGVTGASPLADAPPFVQLRARISRQDLAAMLALRTSDTHPRMPLFTADEDETAALLDYWESLATASPR